MSSYQFARRIIIGTVGVISGYYISRIKGKNNNVFAVKSNNNLGNIIVKEYVIPGDALEELDLNKFKAVYDRNMRTPKFVIELLTKNNIARCPRRQFREDMNIHTLFRPTEEDYKATQIVKGGKPRNAFDKGHLACKSNYSNDEEAKEEASILSIITPQNNKFNCGVWKALEEYVQNLIPKYEFLIVCSGPLYLPREIDVDELKRKNENSLKLLYGDSYDYRKDSLSGKQKFVIIEKMGDIHVPTHFFKVIIAESESGIELQEGYIIKNAPISGKSFEKNRQQFQVDISKIEKETGYLFTSGYVQEKIEELKGNIPDLCRPKL